MRTGNSDGGTRERILQHVLRDIHVRDRLQFEEILVKDVRASGLESIAGLSEVVTSLLTRVEVLLTGVIPIGFHDAISMLCLATGAAEEWGYDWPNVEADLEIVTNIVAGLQAFCDDPDKTAKLREVSEMIGIVYTGLRSQHAIRSTGGTSVLG
jgi:hypothetical protein